MKLLSRINTLLGNFMGKKVTEVERLCNHDYWLTAYEAKAAGVVDNAI